MAKYASEAFYINVGVSSADSCVTWCYYALLMTLFRQLCSPSGLWHC